MASPLTAHCHHWTPGKWYCSKECKPTPPIPREAAQSRLGIFQDDMEGMPRPKYPDVHHETDHWECGQLKIRKDPPPNPWKDVQ